MPIDTGKLTEKLELQMLTVTTGDTNGAPKENWNTYRVIYASITRQQGNVTFDEGYEYNDRISFFCRFTPLDKKGTRIFYNGEYYKITNVTHVPRNENTILDCQITNG